jgi:hypothetical protein
MTNDTAQPTDEFTPAQLDRIARALNGQLDDDHLGQLARDIADQIRTKVTIADYDEDLVFVAYEMAYSECHAAYANGKKTRDARDRVRDELAKLAREDFGSEVTSYEIERQEQRLAGYAKRLDFWRAYYVAATQVLTEVVDASPDSLQRFMTRTFTPADRKPKPLDRRSARYRAAVLGREADRQREANSHQPVYDGIDAA